jgi:hypothetical protein
MARPFSQPPSSQVNVRLPDELIGQLKLRAAREGVTQSDLIRGVLTASVRSPGRGQFGDFHNRLRILACIDRDELVAAGIDVGEWLAFQSDPWRWLIRASDQDAARVWAILDARSAPK